MTKIDVASKANDNQKEEIAANSPGSSADTYQELMKDLDDLLKEDDEDQNNANWKVSTIKAKAKII